MAATPFFWMAAVLIGIAVVLLLWPLRRRAVAAEAEVEGELSIYRDQLDEIERDRGIGRIGEEEARAARLEVERRMLAAMDRARAAPRRSPPLRIALVAAAVGAPALALFIYADLGRPGLPDQPIAARVPASVPPGEAGEMAARAEALAERLKRDGGSFEDWWLLGQSLAFLERYAEAARAFGRAADANPDDPRVRGVYGETLVRAAGGRVTPDAEMAFRAVLEARPDDPRARYYVGLAAAQTEHFDEALDIWQGLYRDSPADAPWLAAVRQGLVDMASVLGRDPAEIVPEPSPGELARSEALPDPTPPAAGDLDELRARLETAPRDFEGWLALARGLASRGDEAGARAAIARVKEVYAGAPFVQQQIAKAEAALGLGSAAADAGGGRGPSADDVRAAQEMSPEEQKEMIAGMVGSLAARLEDEPQDLQGWLMLMRSYGVLGDAQAASDAYERARGHFAGDAGALAQLERQARVSGLLR